MTAQIATHEVVYSIILEQTEWAFSRVGVEGRFGYELRPSPKLRHYPRDGHRSAMLVVAIQRPGTPLG